MSTTLFRHELHSNTNKFAILSFNVANRCIRILIVNEKRLIVIIGICLAEIPLCYNSVKAHLVDTYSSYFLINLNDIAIKNLLYFLGDHADQWYKLRLHLRFWKTVLSSLSGCMLLSETICAIRLKHCGHIGTQKGLRHYVQSIEWTKGIVDPWLIYAQTESRDSKWELILTKWYHLRCLHWRIVATIYPIWSEGTLRSQLKTFPAQRTVICVCLGNI